MEVIPERMDAAGDGDDEKGLVGKKLDPSRTRDFFRHGSLEKRDCGFG